MITSHLIPISCLSMALAVGAGAFGAHGLKDIVTPERLATWNTAVFYQIVHSITLLILGIAMKSNTLSTEIIRTPSTLFFVGLTIFSLTLYALVLTNTGWLGAITPIGGTLLIVGWVLLAWNTLQ